MTRVKLRLILLYGKNIEFKTAKYDPDYGVATVKGGRWFRKGVATRYLVDLKDIFYPAKGRGKPHVLIDAHKRSSIQPKETVKEKSVINIAENPDPSLKGRLDYMNEHTFWGSLIIKMKTPFHVVMLCMLAGMGLYSFVRMLLAAFGYYLP